MLLNGKVLELGFSRFEDTAGLSREEWIEERRKGIGGSDAGAVMGLSAYATPLTVYFSKKGFDSFNGNAATEWGNILENPIRQKTREELGCLVCECGGTFISKKRPFMRANLDGLVLAEKEIEIAGEKASGLLGHEIKTSRNGAGFGEKEVPDSYFAQVQHYMAVTGLDAFVLTVFVLDRREGRHYLVKRNAAFIKRLIEKEAEFWEKNVLADCPPEPTGNEKEAETVRALSVGASAELDGSFAALIEERQSLEAQAKELEKKSEAIKEKIIMALSESSLGEVGEKVSASCGKWKISYNLQMRQSADANALKRDGLLEKYSKTSSFRVLRIFESKKAK